MSHTIAAPRLTDEGVVFMVEVGFSDRQCLVSRNALARLRKTRSSELDLMSTYREYEDKIQSVARRLVVAGVSGTPLVLGTAYFV